ncbi:hypothetical protein M9H77_30463 [Catharanthus roseus]|uniref:Uncharacterized protein n=1 Tax=Catharanthus roseus TaxID=4058 RepID=A0ACB9ZXQ0_CATRO|nr:hypothetical protein M9H77_30463 [Catharanthus roseus]
MLTCELVILLHDQSFLHFEEYISIAYNRHGVPWTYNAETSLKSMVRSCAPSPAIPLPSTSDNLALAFASYLRPSIAPLSLYISMRTNCAKLKLGAKILMGVTVKISCSRILRETGVATLYGRVMSSPLMWLYNHHSIGNPWQLQL